MLALIEHPDERVKLLGDPALNADPDRFDVSRPRVKHDLFGAGRHFCLGNQLARLELKICLEEALRRLPALELAGPVVKKPGNSFHWMIAMPVCFQPAARASAARITRSGAA